MSSLAELREPRRSLAEDTLRWCDAFWNPARGLARAPEGADVGDAHLVRESAWYAYGLLLRGADGDAPRAIRCIESLLELQYDEPGTAWHGTFAKLAETPHPPDDARMWLDYDPNWRQFIGTTFLVLLADFEARLPPDLVRRMEGALRLAVEGEPPERVPASYTNIALMKAWLEVEAGERLGERAWTRTGESLAREVFDDYARLGAFAEYNSPTYYGIDFYALVLWRALSSSPTLRELGARLEAALWNDVARWYHAGLRNLCGPYSRTYGMDMQSYVALLGLDLWAAGAGRDAAPLPRLEPAADHGHDLFLGALKARLEPRVPDAARKALIAFPGEHLVEQRVSDDPVRVATGWLGERVMIGAESCDSNRLSSWDQYVPATLHWASGWILVRSRAASRAVAKPGLLEVEWEPAAAEDELRVTVSAPGVEPDLLRGDRWRLPGLDVSVEAHGLDPAVRAVGPGAQVAFRPRVRTGGSAHVLRLRPEV